MGRVMGWRRDDNYEDGKAPGGGGGGGGGTT